jgi:acyl-ACP thioesterase
VREFTGTRTVRLGDAGLDGTLRLDALARFLQDIAADDAADVGLRDASWVVRRTVLTLQGRPRYGERISLTTYCGGLGSRWAERRTDVVGPSSRIEAASLWVYLDPSGRPSPLPPLYLEAYAETAAGRTVSSRLTLPGPPEGAGPGEAWPLRATDFDVLGHVNNAVYWAVVEDEPIVEGRAELEYRVPIEPGTSARLVVSADRRSRWLVSDAGVHAAAVLSSSRSNTTEPRITTSPASSSTSPAL